MEGYFTTDIDALLECRPQLDVQLTCAVGQAVLWFFFIKFFTAWVVIPYASKRPWKDQFTKLNQNTFRVSYGVEFDDEAAFKFACLFVSILLQHAVGGALCLPSVTGWGPQKLAATLARHGALCEVGWELQDIATRAYQIILGGPEGRAQNPLPLCIIMAFHHSLAMGMVIPMNLFQPDNVWYHEMVLLLQLAAFIAMGLQMYGYTLNITKDSGLKQMKICVTITWCVIFYSRVARYLYVVYKLLSGFYKAGHTGLMYGGSTAVFLMSLLNVLFFLDATGKAKKFLPMSLKKNTEEEITETLIRAASSFSLQRRRKDAAKLRWTKVRGAVALGLMKDSKTKKAE